MSSLTSPSQPFSARLATQGAATSQVPAASLEGAATARTLELEHYRRALVQQRELLLRDLSALVRDVAIAPTGNPLADGAAECDLQDTSLGLADGEERTVWLIDRALAKLDGLGALPYGICEYSRLPIPRERLELMPWTPLSIEGATYLEERFLDLEDLPI